ncbi:hypothetical protein A9Q84_02205 [Halobacteriovorax marinus]|uniref:MATE family efflux transporter n=1 Tax=Halobacteriovorax marinus TaxID=97084 RepID=A0A1Y5FCD6_9BACT|nr:hypothetical protein A9Q84_02205 [Halobacteriovorax marinus]
MDNQIKLTSSGLFLFSLPSILGSLLEPITGVVDTALIGNFNTTWLAALSLGVILLSSFTWVFNFLIHTSTQAVSEAYSKRDFKEVSGRIKVALILSLIIGVLSSIGLYIFRGFLFKLIGVTPELSPIVDSYYSIRLIGHTFLIISGTLISILRGFGLVRVCFGLIFISTAINVSLSWYWLYYTDLGIAAVAWGSVVAAVVSMLTGMYFVFKKKEISFSLFLVPVERHEWINFGKNSLNMFFRSLILTTCFFLSTRFAARLGTYPLAAHQILLEFWLFSSFLIDGVALSGNILAAKFKAQRNISDYKTMEKKLLFLGLLIGLLFTITYLCIPNLLWSIFTNDQVVKDELSKVWIFLALAQVIVSISYVYDGLLFGLGKFSYLKTQMFFAFFIAFLPFSLYSFYSNSLTPIWLSLISLGFYRLFIGYFGTKRPWESVCE